MKTKNGNYPEVGIGVMILKGNRILLGKRKAIYGNNYYAFPGGRLENKESLAIGAFREVKEETGIEINTCDFLCVINFVLSGRHFSDFIFITSVSDSTKAFLMEKEKAESWDWYSMNDLPHPLFLPTEYAIKNFSSPNRKTLIDLCGYSD